MSSLAADCTCPSGDCRSDFYVWRNRSTSELVRSSGEQQKYLQIVLCSSGREKRKQVLDWVIGFFFCAVVGKRLSGPSKFWCEPQVEIRLRNWDKNVFGVLRENTWQNRTCRIIAWNGISSSGAFAKRKKLRPLEQIKVSLYLLAVFWRRTARQYSNFFRIRKNDDQTKTQNRDCRYRSATPRFHAVLTLHALIN